MAITPEVIARARPGLYRGCMASRCSAVGDVLRDWRKRRRVSQLELAAEADLSTRHLSFVESGRSEASREVLLRLAMPLRERNRLLLAGGYAPAHTERPLDSEEMAEARAAVDAVLTAQEPFPALAVDRHWSMVAANAAVPPLLEGVSGPLLEPPLNVLRLTLHPEGLAPRIANLAQWRHHILGRLRAQADAAADLRLLDLAAELEAFPAPASRSRPCPASRVAVPLQLRTSGGRVLSLLSTTTVFGTATDVTLSELALECFYPADEATRAHFLAR